MKESKRIEIEEKLRELFRQAERGEKTTAASEAKPSGVRVIRRRRGAPDLRIV